MCIQIFPTYNSIQIALMYSSKQKLSIENSSDTNNQININPTYSNVDSPIRSYALIETNSNELDHIIDLLRHFFPTTRIIEYNNNNQNYSSNITTSQQQRTSIESNYPISSFENDINNRQISSNVNSPTFKGKVKDYLQRRYLEQLDEHQSRKDIFTKSHSSNIASFDSTPSSINNKSSTTLKSHSFDSSSFSIQNSKSKPENHPIIRSQSKRGLLQRSETIDMDDDIGYKTLSIDQLDDDDEEIEEEEDEDEESPSFRHSYTEQQTNNKISQFLIPSHHPCEQEQEKQILSYPSRLSLPLTPYSVSSDPGPFHSPWFNTPTSTFNFRFPQSQEQLVANAQGSIAQLSTLTKMLCDETSLFTPISPRFKANRHDSNTSKSSSSVPPCQICREEFDSHQMYEYLTHYRTHLESSCEDDKSDILNSDANCDRSDDLRNYSCRICSKRFSRDMLNRHLRLHSGIRPYRCTLCNTYFSRSDHLSTHLRTHTGEKPYTCPHCPYTACRRDMITRHLKIHTKQRSERKNATSTFSSSNDP